MIRFALGLLLAASCYPQAATALHDPAVAQFIREMETEHGFEAKGLKDLFNRVRISKHVLAAISRPTEAKPWHEYRSIFVTPERTREGVRFWRKNTQSLLAAERRYGVAPEVAVAIIGIETFYGRHPGKYRVADALSTLAFYYPKRAAFFRAELKQFLLMTREQGVNALQLMGSYAGAMGLPQFISSSFRTYAVDFNRDGRIDIWDDPTDAIGSVANYLQRHGWERGRPIAMRVRIDKSGYKPLLNGALKPGIPWSQIKRCGMVPESDVASDPPVMVVELDLGAENEYWLGFNNFYTITRYNHSSLYAMAVYQLASAIRSEYLGR